MALTQPWESSSTMSLICVQSSSIETLINLTVWLFSFSLCSKALADYSKDFVVSVILGKDLVPR